MKTLGFIWTLFRKFPARLVSVVFWSTALSLVEVAGIFSIAPVVDLFIHPDMNNISVVTKKFIVLMELAGAQITITNFVFIFLVFNVFKALFAVLARYSILQTKYAVLKSMLFEIYNAFFNARWHFFSSSRQGTLLNTFSREMTVVGNSFGTIGLMFSNIFRMLFFIMIPFYISWQVSLIGIGLGSVIAIPMMALGRTNYRLGQKNTSTANKMSEVVQESFGAAKIILGYGNQHKNIAELSKSFDQHRAVTVKSQTLNFGTPLIYEPFGLAVILFASYIGFKHFNVQISEAVIILYALRTIIPMIGQVVTQKNTLSNFFPSYEQVNRIKDSAIEQVQKTGELAFKSLGDSIELKGVCFSYPNKEPVLKNIDATIKKGKMTAFVGESGAGKSTIVDLLIGFNEPDNGIVTMDGIPLFDYDINSFRQRIGYVPQDCILFNTTIRDNLLWSKDDASESDIVEACKLANAHDFIKAMPEGYNSIVGDRGVQLSGGQRQRVALSRAILRKPELLILDEATSSLDSQSEILIQEAIERIAHQTTIVVIAHRLSTIARADWIYVIAGGEVVEQGTYRDLINLNGSFKNMAGSQGLVH